MSIFKKKENNIPKRRSIKYSQESPSNSNIYKRNRTLTGTTSNHFDSANTKTDLESPRVRAHNLSIRRRKIAGILIIIIISIIPIWILISNFTASVNVTIKDVTTSKIKESTKYKNVIQDYLNINPMSRLLFIVDKSSVSEYVSSKLPEVSKITKINMEGIGKANYEIVMRSPIAGWQINSKQYYVDSKGIPFEQNYFSTPSVQIIDNSGIAPKTGTTAIASNRFLSFVGRVVYLAKSSGYTVIQAALPANTTRELEIRLKEGNYLIKLSIDRPVGEQVEDMVAAVKYFSNRNQTTEYIDVRVSGKAFYK